MGRIVSYPFPITLYSESHSARSFYGWGGYVYDCPYTLITHSPTMYELRTTKKVYPSHEPANKMARLYCHIVYGSMIPYNPWRVNRCEEWPDIALTHLRGSLGINITPDKATTVEIRVAHQGIDYAEPPIGVDSGTYRTIYCKSESDFGGSEGDIRWLDVDVPLNYLSPGEPVPGYTEGSPLCNNSVVSLYIMRYEDYQSELSEDYLPEGDYSLFSNNLRYYGIATDPNSRRRRAAASQAGAGFTGALAGEMRRI